MSWILVFSRNHFPSELKIINCILLECLCVVCIAMQELCQSSLFLRWFVYVWVFMLGPSQQSGLRCLLHLDCGHFWKRTLGLSCLNWTILFYIQTGSGQPTWAFKKTFEPKLQNHCFAVQYSTCTGMQAALQGARGSSHEWQREGNYCLDNLSPLPWSWRWAQQCGSCTVGRSERQWTRGSQYCVAYLLHVLTVSGLHHSAGEKTCRV